MNNKRIYLLAYSLLKNYLWEQPSRITGEQQAAALETLKSVLELLKKAKPISHKSCGTVYMEYVHRLFQVENELCTLCYYNACHELRCLFERDRIFEKQVLYNVIDTLKKHLSGRFTVEVVHRAPPRKTILEECNNGNGKDSLQTASHR